MKKTAVVTGSSRGIGFAIAKQLGMDGYNIVMVATGLQEKNQAALDELQALGIACAYVQANIGNQEDRQKILDGALAAFGRVDVLVNNAGVAPKVRADLLDMSEESFDYVVGINTKGNMFLTQLIATVYKGNIIKNLIMDCQSYTKYRPNETTGGIFVSWRRKEELPTGA